MKIECEICGKIMDKNDYPKYSYLQFASRRFCSKQCKWKDGDYRALMKKAVEKSNKNPSKKKIESARNMGEANKGEHRSVETEFKSGELNPNWCGGTKKYRGEDWKKQREKAIERDKGICQRCGCDGNEVHHIFPYSDSKDNSLDNLITLCKRCHIIHERGYSTLVVCGEDILIKHVPEKTLNSFIELSEQEFNGNIAMTLKWLMDDIVGQESKIIISKIEELESRVISLESNKEPVKEVKVRKMCDGTERKVKQND